MDPRKYILSPYTFAAAEACPAARVYRGTKRAPSHAMWHGIAVHRFIEYALRRDRDYALAYIRNKFPRRLKFCESIDLEAIPAGTPEPQFVIDPREQFALLVDAQSVRAEAAARDHVIVKGDLLVDGEPWAVDFKTGKHEVDPRGPQAMLEALAVWLHFKRPATVRTTVLRITKGGPPPVHTDWSTPELVASLKRVRRVHLQVLETRAEFYQEALEPDFAPGDHCYRCDARLTCPEAPDPDADK